MKILVFANSILARDSRVKRHCQHLATSGHDVSFIGPFDNVTLPVRGVCISPLEYSRNPKKSIRNLFVEYLKISYFVARHMWRNRNMKYDIILVNNMPNFVCIFAAMHKIKFDTRVLLDVHDSMHQIYSSGARKIFKPISFLFSLEERISYAFADSILTVNNKFKSDVGKKTRKKIRVVHNAPHFPHEDRHGNCEAWSFSGMLNFVHHGNIHARNGLEKSIRYVHYAVEKGISCDLKIYGDGPHKASLVDYVEVLGASAYVSFYPAFAPEEVRNLLRGSCVGLVTPERSLQMNSALHVKILEYAAYGVPIICTDLETVANYFGDAVFYADDQSKFLEAISKLESEGATRAAAAKKVVDRLSWQAEKYIFEEFINESIDCKRHR